MIKAKTFIIDNMELFERLETYSKKIKSDLFVYDVETDGLVERKVRLFGMGVCFNEDYGFYIVWRNKEGNIIWNNKDQNRIVNWLLETCSKKKLIGQNIKYDVLVTKYTLGIDLTDFIYSDTQLQKHTIDENPPHGLKTNAVRFLGDWADDAQDELKESVIANGGKWNKENKDMYMADTEILGKYCIWDVLLTLKLFKLYDKRLEKEGLLDLFYNEEVMPLLKEVTIPMKMIGVPVDVEHFQKMKKDIEKELISIEKQIIDEIKDDVKDYEQTLLDKTVPIMTTGLFPVLLCQYIGCPLPVNPKTNKTSLAKGLIQAYVDKYPEFKDVYTWILNKDNSCLPKSLGNNLQELLYNDGIDRVFYEVRSSRYKELKGGNFVFNIGSSDDLSFLFFKIKGYSPIKITDANKFSVDEGVLENLAFTAKDPIALKVVDFRKLRKILSTYVEAILNLNIDGVVYPDMNQTGTTSGRYSCSRPNFLNLPSVKEDGQLTPLVTKYTNMIRAGIKAPKGKKLIVSDWSSLEPRLVAFVTGDAGLLDIFTSGKDFYSTIAIKQFKIDDASPFKSDKNYLGKLQKPMRNLVKTYALASLYGAEASRISQVTGKSVKEAQQLINGYFRAFPDVAKLIRNTHFLAKTKGHVKTKLGRVRHLNFVKECHEKYNLEKLLNYKWARQQGLIKERGKVKNLLNNAVNFQIQGFGAHCLNRAKININRELKEKKLNAQIILSVYDEIIVMADENVSQEVLQIVKNNMENCVDTSPIKLLAEPEIGDTYAEAK